MKLTDLPYLSEKREKTLQAEGISSIRDLINFIPRRYLDRTSIQSIAHVQGIGEEVTVIGEVNYVGVVGKGRKRRLEVLIQDQNASLKGVWFRGISYIKNWIKKGQVLAFSGKAKRFGRIISIAHPEINFINEDKKVDDIQRIVPIYSGSKAFDQAKITDRLLQYWILHILENIQFDEFLPYELLEYYQLPYRHAAYRMIHQPESSNEFKIAHWRFKFEELFLFELGVAHVKHSVLEKQKGAIFKHSDPNTHTFFNEHLPFYLTSDQKKALSDIKRDVRSGHQMNRLLQGDVGSGKTVVALGALLMAIDNGYQTAFMAPTEILAEQHFHTLNKFLKPLDINIRLLVGHQNAKLREDILTDIASGNSQILVGTHAVFQKEVKFGNLGLFVIDEQHRFGVNQRGSLLSKGEHPHILVMSATPIPRSLALTLYSDMDLSLIKEMPAGRKTIKTAWRKENQRDDVYNFVEEQVDKGGQAYVVYPLVEESENLDLKHATEGYESLRKRFPKANVGLLHGRMKSEEKEEVMSSFVRGELDILVSTTVVEVGVDVSNANMMIIEHAERFGLSQLHQLRGRIGRGERQSYCILMSDYKLGETARQRLSTMVQTNSGFEIAEKDLQLRGPGDFLGTRQSGLPEFRFSDILQDQPILEIAKKDAWTLIKENPDLKGEKYAKLKHVLEQYLEDRKDYFNLI